MLDKTFDNVLPADDHVPLANGLAFNPTVSVTGNIAYTNGDALIVENVITGQRHSFTKPSSKSLSIHWSPDGHYGVLLGDSVWLIEPEAGTLTLVKQGYVPADLNLNQHRPLWSPDSQQVLFISTGKLYHLAANTMQMVTFPFNASDNVSNVMWHWTANNHAFINGIDDAVGHNIVYTDSPITDAVKRIDLGDKVYGPADISAESRYIAYMAEGAVIYDTQDGTSRPLRPAADGYNSNFGGEVTWSPSSDWLLIFDDALIAGGTTVRYLGVTRADGFERPDLSFMFAPTANTFNWLPSQVKPEMLPPPLKKPLEPQPKQVLHGTDWSFALSWNPDGKQVAGNNSLSNDGVIKIWNVASGQEATLPAPNIGTAAHSQFRWQRTTEGVYTPTIELLPTLSSMAGNLILGMSADGR